MHNDWAIPQKRLFYNKTVILALRTLTEQNALLIPNTLLCNIR